MRRIKNILTYSIVSLYVITLIFITINLFYENSLGQFYWNGYKDNITISILDSALEIIFWIEFTKYYFLITGAVVCLLLFLDNTKFSFSIKTLVVCSLLVIFQNISTEKLLIQQYLILFEYQEVTEGELKKPLEKAGYGICEPLNEKISNPLYERRRYAIDAMGKFKYEPAIENLRKMLYDSNEKYYIKGDCIEALNEIDTKESKEIVKIYVSNLHPKNDSTTINYLKLTSQIR